MLYIPHGPLRGTRGERRDGDDLELSAQVGQRGVGFPETDPALDDALRLVYDKPADVYGLGNFIILYRHAVFRTSVLVRHSFPFSAFRDIAW